jgi:pimeloyl-ACP methyl ester carboxylesterase
MAETIALNQSSSWITLGSSGMRLRSSGLTGNLVWRRPEEHPQLTASVMAPGLVAGATPDLIEQALKEAGFSDQGSLSGPAGTASMSAVPGKFVLDRPIPRNRVEFAIYRDESGVISLHQPFPAPPTAELLASAASTEQTSLNYRYVIPLRHAATPTGGVPLTAMLGGIGGKVIRFVSRAATGLAGYAVYAAAKLWEDTYRAAQGVHWGETPAQLLATPPIQPTSDNFEALQGNKSLLFIHGTISSTVGGYKGLLNFPQQASALYAKYGSRVIGFNHHTLTKSVPQNALDFLSGLQPGDYLFDVISHSRGGLVARALKELTPAQLGQLLDPPRNPPPGVNVQIDNVVLVGTPNQGTPLANPTDLPKAVSRLASIASAFSQEIAAAGLGALFAIFGGIVEGGLAILPGLEDMNPGNPFLAQLNSASSNVAPYYGIEADFQPTGGLATAILSNGVDALFQGAENDLVVPTLGVSELNGNTLPTTNVDLYPPNTNVYHTDYFYQQPTWTSILGFL